MIGQQSKRRQRSYEQESLRHLARANTVSLIQSLEQIALSRLKQNEDVKELAEAVKSLASGIKGRKVQVPEAFKRLERLLDKVSSPSPDPDIIRAATALLERGWGKPALEAPEPSDLDVNDSASTELAVRRAMLAKALAGDVAAQQVWLKLPTALELRGGLTNLSPQAMAALSEDELATFMALVTKLQKAAEPEEDE